MTDEGGKMITRLTGAQVETLRGLLRQIWTDIDGRRIRFKVEGRCRSIGQVGLGELVDALEPDVEINVPKSTEELRELIESREFIVGDVRALDAARTYFEKMKDNNIN